LKPIASYIHLLRQGTAAVPGIDESHLAALAQFDAAATEASTEDTSDKGSNYEAVVPPPHLVRQFREIRRAAVGSGSFGDKPVIEIKSPRTFQCAEDTSLISTIRLAGYHSPGDDNAIITSETTHNNAMVLRSMAPPILQAAIDHLTEELRRIEEKHEADEPLSPFERQVNAIFNLLLGRNGVEADIKLSSRFLLGSLNLETIEKIASHPQYKQVLEVFWPKIFLHGDLGLVSQYISLKLRSSSEQDVEAIRIVMRLLIMGNPKRVKDIIKYLVSLGHYDVVNALFFFGYDWNAEISSLTLFRAHPELLEIFPQVLTELHDEDPLLYIDPRDVHSGTIEYIDPTALDQRVVNAMKSRSLGVLGVALHLNRFHRLVKNREVAALFSERAQTSIVTQLKSGLKTTVARFENLIAHLENLIEEPQGLELLRETIEDEVKALELKCILNEDSFKIYHATEEIAPPNIARVVIPRASTTTALTVSRGQDLPLEPEELTLHTVLRLIRSGAETLAADLALTSFSPVKSWRVIMKRLSVRQAARVFQFSYSIDEVAAYIYDLYNQQSVSDYDPNMEARLVDVLSELPLTTSHPRGITLDDLLYYLLSSPNQNYANVGRTLLTDSHFYGGDLVQGRFSRAFDLMVTLNDPLEWRSFIEIIQDGKIKDGSSVTAPHLSRGPSGYQKKALEATGLLKSTSIRDQNRGVTVLVKLIKDKLIPDDFKVKLVPFLLKSAVGNKRAFAATTDLHTTKLVSLSRVQDQIDEFVASHGAPDFFARRRLRLLRAEGDYQAIENIVIQNSASSRHALSILIEDKQSIRGIKISHFKYLNEFSFAGVPIDAEQAEAIHTQTGSLRGVDLRGQDLSNKVLRAADLTHSLLDNVILDGTDLRGAYLPNLVGDVSFKGAILDIKQAEHIVAHGGSLRGANLRKVYFVGAWLIEADLRDVDLRGADLSEFMMRGVNLEGADLTGAKLNEYTYADQVKGAIIDGDQALQIMLYEERTLGYKRLAPGTRIRGGDFRGFSFKDADIGNVEFEDCDIDGADFRDAKNVYGVEFWEMEIDGALFDDRPVIRWS